MGAWCIVFPFGVPEVDCSIAMIFEAIPPSYDARSIDFAHLTHLTSLWNITVQGAPLLQQVMLKRTNQAL